MVITMKIYQIFGQHPFENYFIQTVNNWTFHDSDYVINFVIISFCAK